MPAASGRVTAGTTRAVPDCSTNHSSADRIVVNSYSSALPLLTRQAEGDIDASPGGVPMVSVVDTVVTLCLPDKLKVTLMPVRVVSPCSVW